MKTSTDSGFGNAEPRAAAGASAAKLLVGLGLVTLLVAVLPGSASLFRPATVALGAWGIALGLTAATVPWKRLPVPPAVVVVPLALGLVAAAATFEGVHPAAYGAYFIAVFAWIGAHHRTGRSFVIAPLAAVAYVAPAIASTRMPSSAVESVAVVIPVCVLVAETIARTRARVVSAERESQRRADLLAIGASAARRIHSLEPEQIFKLVVDATIELGAAGGALVLVDEDRAEFHVANARGSCENIALPDTLLRDVLASQRTATTASDPILVALPVRGSARRSAIVVASFARRPAPQDIEALELVASQAGPALENAERFRQEQRAKTLAEVSSLKDPLTGAGNRRKGGMLLDQLRTGDAVVIVDIDKFKHVNDTYGHSAGDELLRSFVSSARATLRGSDEVIRYGGDEFLLLLPGGGDVAASALERLHESWRALHPGTSFSAGIAIRDDTEAPAVTLAKADRALYAAKRSGRDSTRVYDELPAVERNAS